MSWSLFVAASGVALALLPLSESPGYEFSLAVSLLLTPAVGHMAALWPSRVRNQRAPFQGAVHPGWRLLMAALFPALLLILIPMVIIAINILRVPPCNLITGLLFVVLLPLAGIVFAAALGLLIGLLIPSAKIASVAWFATWIALVAAGIHGFYSSSAVFVFNPIFGWFPGAIYDRSVAIESTLVIYRFNTLSQIALLVFAIDGLVDPATLQLSLMRLRGRSVALLPVSVFALIVGGFAVLGNHIGFRTDSADLQRQLPIVEEAGSLRLHFPAGTPADVRSRTVSDASFSLYRVQEYLRLSRPGPSIDIYLFKNAADKNRVMGAAGTNVAKPWRGEIYVIIDEIPHNILRHELVHAALAPHGRGPLKVAGSLGGWIPDMGIIEGVAVAAADGGAGDFSADEWSAAMLRERLLPDPARLMGPGFFTVDASSAYTAAGSFFRFIRSRWGALALLKIYAGQSFRDVTGRNLSELTAQWHEILSRIPASAALRQAARFRFDRPSIVRTRCVHEVSVLLDQARECTAVGDYGEADALHRRAMQISGEADDVKLSRLSSLIASGNADAARVLASDLLSRKRLGAVRESTIREWLADLDNAQGKTESAKTAYGNLIETGAPGRRRVLAVKAHLAALNSAQADAVIRILSSTRPERSLSPAQTVLQIVRAVGRHPDDPVLAYLLGRQYYNHGEWGGAIAELERAEKQPELINAEIHSEIQTLIGKSLFFSGRMDAARNRFRKALREPLISAGRRETLEDWIARCDYPPQTK